MPAEFQTRDPLGQAEGVRSALDEHCGVMLTDSSGRILSVNDALCTVTKYAREELVGRDPRMLNSGFHTKDYIRKLWNTLASRRTWQGDLKNRAKDGTFFWARTTIVPVPDDLGTGVNYLALYTVFNDPYPAEEKAAYLAAIVDSSGDAIVGKNLQGIVSSWNHGAERIFGYTAAEMIGQSILKLIPEDRRSEEDRILAKIAQGETVEHFDTLRLHKNGSPVTVSVSVSAIKDSSGRIIGAAKVARDISERKRWESTIRSLNLTLERRVAERTAQLEAANQELEAFSYSVSHDLRAPLRAIDGFTQAVCEDYGPLLPSDGKRYLDTIRFSAQRMGDLIDDLLAFARLSRQEIKAKEVDMAAIVRECLDELGAPWPGRGVEVEIADLPRVQGDAAMVKQVWSNLLSNAVKYSRGREPARIEVGCAPRGAATEFFVRDNGTGFDMRYYDKLFGVFQRLHRPEDFEGTGVGLAIVKRIVARHGGSVRAESVQGHGATFYFTL